MIHKVNVWKVLFLSHLEFLMNAVQDYKIDRFNRLMAIDAYMRSPRILPLMAIDAYLRSPNLA